MTRPAYQSIEHRYQTDAMFHQLVDLMEHMIHQGKYTPSELREAAILAATNFEIHRYSYRMVIPKESLHLPEIDR